jgi:hypothetical protein
MRGHSTPQEMVKEKYQPQVLASYSEAVYQ